MFTNNFDPVAFEILSLSVRWYSLAYIFGIIFGWLYCKKILIKDDVISKLFEDYISYMIHNMCYIIYDLSHITHHIWYIMLIYHIRYVYIYIYTYHAWYIIHDASYMIYHIWYIIYDISYIILNNSSAYSTIVRHTQQ